VRRRQVDAVVAPAARTRELGYGHQLDRGDPDLGELAQVRDRAVERPLARERADVQLVEHLIGERRGLKDAIGPVEARRVEHARAPAQSAGLPARARVGQLLAVDHERVVLAFGRLGGRLEHAAAGVVEPDIAAIDA